MSKSSRVNLKEGIKLVMHRKAAVLSILAYSISTGVQGHWQSVMAINFESLGITETDVGWIGLLIVAVSTVCGIVLAVCADYFHSKLRLSLMLALGSAGLCLIWLALLAEKLIEFSNVQFWIAAVLASSFVNSTKSLFVEYAAEMSRPTPEGMVGALLNAGFNLVRTF